MSKEIKYNRDNKDFDLFLDGRYVGSAPTPAEAERRLTEMVYTILTSGQ